MIIALIETLNLTEDAALDNVLFVEQEKERFVYTSWRKENIDVKEYSCGLICMGPKTIGIFDYFMVVIIVTMLARAKKKILFVSCNGLQKIG